MVQNTSQMWTKQTKREEPPQNEYNVTKEDNVNEKKKTNKTPQKTITRVFCV